MKGGDGTDRAKNEKTQYTTRLSTELLSRAQEIANTTGASTASVLSMLVALGLKIYEGTIIMAPVIELNRRSE